LRPTVARVARKARSYRVTCLIDARVVRKARSYSALL
jgi:hypothetical protein